MQDRYRGSLRHVLQSSSMLNVTTLGSGVRGRYLPAFRSNDVGALCCDRSIDRSHNRHVTFFGSRQRDASTASADNPRGRESAALQPLSSSWSPTDLYPGLKGARAADASFPSLAKRLRIAPPQSKLCSPRPHPAQLRCAQGPGISRFRVRCFASPRNDGIKWTLSRALAMTATFDFASFRIAKCGDCSILSDLPVRAKTVSA